AVLLTAPVGTCEPIPTEDRWPAVRDAIHHTAVAWELMDPRETRYLMAGRDDFQSDLDVLRRRHADLDDAPRLVECQRLPDRRLVNDLIRANRGFRKGLEQRLVWEADRADLLNLAIEEADVLYRCWDALRDAQCDFYYVTVRRAALKKLRDAIGAEAFAAGDLPHHIPVWRFAAP
ncbi:MAG: hypothetical protein K2V38_28615, partial [Gemmataceae bacterium]|nr:hypothetical protein [Gemmataceae bacterium]